MTKIKGNTDLKISMLKVILIFMEKKLAWKSGRSDTEQNDGC